MKYLTAIALLIVGITAYAGNVSSTGRITKLYSYSEQGGFDGDVYVIMSNSHTSCSGGYWLRKADTLGYKNTLSFLLSAFHAGTTVTVSALNDAPNIWTGSGSPTCRLDQISLNK